MPSYAIAGSVPPKRHTQFRRPDGGLYAEELVSTAGFAGAYSLAYHLAPPTATRDVRVWERSLPTFAENRPPRNRHFKTIEASGAMPARGHDAIDGRIAIVGNADLVVSVADVTESMPYFYRNAGGDELIFVHRGTGTLETPFGELAYRAHDYLVIPAGTVYRFGPTTPSRIVVFASRGRIEIPRKFRNDFGQLIEGAPYHERDFRTPHLRPPIAATGEYEIRTSNRGRDAIYTVANHPFDLVGWDGYCYPYAFNVDDYAPITGMLHQPPTAHATFDAPGAAFCAFVPRRLDSHPLAIAVPYNHSNVDCDEVLYYVSGDFLSRRGIAEGSLTLHAAGAPHGPQPGAVEASLGRTETNELAIMVDTFAPLGVADAALGCEDAAYFRSWLVQV